MKDKLVKKSYDRILQISEDAQQITMPDSRYYRRNGKYYPSVTYVLQVYPKGKHFEDWLKKVGYSADYVVRKAAEEGTKVHEMIEEYLEGNELKFLDNYNRPQYHPDVWQMFLRFVDFWETNKPKLIETEVHLFSDEMEVAGTADLVCEIEGETWIIDHKTSNHPQSIYHLQTSAYGKMFEECYGKRPDRFGVLWLKSSKRKHSKDKMQGPGWEIIESDKTYEENLEIFKLVKKIFDIENPKVTPSFTEFRTSVKRNH